MDIPVYINCRDRVSDLRNLVTWLEKAGHERIIFLDNDSDYPALLEYYEQTPHEVRYLGENHGARSIWLANLVPNEWFVYTDPDVLPIEDCPFDAVFYLYELMQFHAHPKAGLGLYLDDIPEIQSLGWERDLVAQHKEVRKGVFDSLVDTTLALYRPNSSAAGSGSALRTGFPYQMRHFPWYRLDHPTPEEEHYLARAKTGPMGTTWTLQ